MAVVSGVANSSQPVSFNLSQGAFSFQHCMHVVQHGQASFRPESFGACHVASNIEGNRVAFFKSNHRTPVVLGRGRSRRESAGRVFRGITPIGCREAQHIAIAFVE